MATTNLPKVSARFETILASSYAPAASTYSLASATDINGTALTGYYGVTIDSGTANEQFDVVTISGTTCTVVVRDCDPSNPLASRTRTVPTHGKGASVKITDYPLMGFIRSLLNGDYTFDNILGYTSAPTFTSGNQIVTKAYTDAGFNAGAANASTSVKGIVQEATAAQINSGTATGSTGAILTITPDQLALANIALAAAGTSGTSTGSGNKLVDAADVSNAGASGKIVRLNGTAYPAASGANITGIAASNVTGLAFNVGSHNGTNSRSTSGTVTHAHTLGVVPKEVVITAHGGAGSSMVSSTGTYSNSTVSTSYYQISGSSGPGTDTTNIIYIQTTAGNSLVATISTDATNITLVFTLTGTQSISYSWKAIA